MGFLSKMLGTPQKPKVRTVTAIHFPKKRGYEHIQVTGEQHYQGNLLRLTGRKGTEQIRLDTKAVLMPEPTNPNDWNAVQVQIDGLVVGYMNRQDAKAYVGPMSEAAAVDRVVTCEAWVSTPEGGSVLGVRFFLPDPDRFAQDVRERLPTG